MLLGLHGKVDKAAFDSLCDNLHPKTGEPITRITGEGRRVGYDFTWSAPKSVSVLHAMTGDDAILQAFRTTVRETMNEMEAEMQTRVRKDKQDTDRTTGNWVWSEFVHLTSRPVANVPCPQIHIHCYMAKSEAFIRTALPRASPTTLRARSMERKVCSPRPESRSPASSIKGAFSTASPSTSRTAQKANRSATTKGTGTALEVHYLDGDAVSQEIHGSTTASMGPRPSISTARQNEWYYDGEQVTQKKFEELNRLDEMISRISRTQAPSVR